MGNSKNRIVYIDYVRALCMLWIIGLWHLSEYCYFSLDQSKLASNITVGSLAAFTFVSGIFNGKKCCNLNDVKQFYSKRVIRVIPLFFISCLSLLFLNYINPNICYIVGVKQFVQTLLGVTIFFPPASYTVWYMSMLILFYLITPWINLLPKELYRALTMTGIWLLFLLLEKCVGIDHRALYLLPIYFIGMAFANNKVLFLEYNKLSKCRIALIIIISIVLLCFFSAFDCSIESLLLNLFFNLMVSLVFIILVFSLCMLLEAYMANSFVSNILLALSYSGFVAYLFHRQLLGALYLFLGKFNVFLAYVIILPLVCGLAFAIQKIYDGVLNRIVIKKKRINL